MKYKQRRHYNDAFKREAVQASLVSPQTLSVMAGKLGIHPSLLSRWRSEFIVVRKSSPKAVPNTGPEKSVQDLEREVARLQKQLDRANLENDILKKADEYFAKHLK